MFGQEMEMQRWTALVVAVLFGTIAGAQSDTNAIMGQLGHPVGTELTIEGAFGGGKNSWILVTRVNGTNLIPNVRIGSNLQHPGHNLETQISIICRLKGYETTGVVPNRDPGQQAAPGRYFRFHVAEVLAPDGLKIREQKSPNKASEPSSQSSQVQR